MTGRRHTLMTLARCAAALVGASLVLLGDGLAHADEHSARLPLLPADQQECAACHPAYSPGLLPAASWNRLMANLPSHFGTDASIDAKTWADLSAWLQANAGTGQRAAGSPAEDRINRSAWFVREHREVAPAVWQRKAVGSPARCQACHTQAAQGRFNEHDIRIPQ